MREVQDPQTVSRPTARSRYSRLLPKLIVLGCSGVICLAILEWGVRVFMPYFHPRAQVPFRMTPIGVAMGPPNQTVRMATPKGDYNLLLKFNGYGFRDQKDLRESSAADWFALGDSYTMGWGVQQGERFSDQLEQRLAANSPGPKVFNIAVPENLVGYQRLLRYAETNGANVRNLIVGVCMENDLRDYKENKSAWEIDSAPHVTGGTRTGERLRTWFKDHSALYIAASYGLQKNALTRRLLTSAGVARDVEQLVGKNHWDEAALKSSRDQLVQLVAGRRSMILIIPSRRLWAGNDQATEQKVHETFLDLLRESNFIVVDLRPVLEKAGDPLDYYFRTDPHWNAQGHALAAAELQRHIVSEVQTEKNSN